MWLHLPGHSITLTPTMPRWRWLLAHLPDRKSNRCGCATWRKWRPPEERVRRLLRTLALRGDAFQVVRDLFYHRDRMRELAELATRIAADHDGVEAAQFRDAIGTGRKRAIQILEFLDRTGLTRRVRDRHLLREDSAWLHDLRNP